MRAALEAAAAIMPATSALEQLCSTFNLTNFERDVLLLCVGMELETMTFASLCAQAQSESQLSYPTFNLAMSALAAPHWNAISPNRPLRRSSLIEVVRGKTLTYSPLRINERILHYLMGVDGLDEYFKGVIEPVSYSGELVRSPSVALAESHSTLASQIAGLWSNNWLHQQSTFSIDQLPIVQLCGSEVAAKVAIASTASELSLTWFSSEGR